MTRLSRIFAVIFGCLWAAGAPAQAQDFSGLARVDADQSHIKDRRGGVDVQLALSQGVPYRVRALTDPDRLIVDFREVLWQGVEPARLLSPGRVAATRFGPYRPGWSRMVLDLAEPLLLDRADLAIDQDTGRGLLNLRLRPAGRAEFDAEAARHAALTPSNDWSAGAPSDQPAALTSPGPDDEVVVVLDPGHGGIDPGAENSGVREADLMLTLAREIRDDLGRVGRFRVVLTREEDHFVSLERRVAVAKRAGGDLFVSLHADALARGTAQGATVYVLSNEASDTASAALAERHDRNDILAGVDLSQTDDKVAEVLMDMARLDTQPRSLALAQHLVDQIREGTGTVHKRPLRRASFSVLKSADIPSVLIEVGFLSTAQDLRNLQDPVWRALMVAALRDGIIAWADEDAALAPLRRK